MITIINNLTVNTFILVIITPLMPVLILGLRQYLDNRKAATRLDELMYRANSIWQDIIDDNISETELQKEVNILQNSIFENRRSNPLIVDKFYRYLKDKDEETMNKNVEDLVEGFLESRTL